MPSFRRARVVEEISQRPGLQRVRVETEPDGAAGRAYVLTELTGPVAAGDRVVCNTTAVELGLGTGGWHVVHWNLDAPAFERPGPDHIMKLRYTSLQFDAGTSELEYGDLPRTLHGVPIIVCQLHSQVGVIAAVLGELCPDARVAYVMTDGAALPLVLSDLVDDLCRSGLIDVTITAGHAFGGDLEAVNVASALTLAVHQAHADLVIVGMGPGVVGTGTALGTTAIEVAPILDLAATLGGSAIWAIRASEGDGRSRHAGISHHSETVAALLRSQPLVAPVPPEVAALPHVRVAAEVWEDARPFDVAAVLERAGLRITTMGRDVHADRLFFDACAAAASVAARSLRMRPGTTP